MRTYNGHRQAVRDICFNNSGHKFLSAAYDRYIKLWDTETGKVVSRFSNKKVPYCIKFHPDEERQHLFVAGMADKKIVCVSVISDCCHRECTNNSISLFFFLSGIHDREKQYRNTTVIWELSTRLPLLTRTEDSFPLLTIKVCVSGNGEFEFNHLNCLNTWTFLFENFVMNCPFSMLLDRDIPVDMKYIADPTMHSMPAVTLSPNNKWLGCQSMDNKIVIYSALNRFKLNRKKTFTGHMVAGYACGLDFSPEMRYVNHYLSLT